MPKGHFGPLTFAGLLKCRRIGVAIVEHRLQKRNIILITLFHCLGMEQTFPTTYKLFAGHVILEKAIKTQ